MRTFLEEFGKFLEPLVMGKVNRSNSSWTEHHKTEGFFENMRGRRIWVAERQQIEFDYRVFLPNEDTEEVTLDLDSTFYIVRAGSFNWEEDTDSVLYQVLDGQVFSYYQYVFVRAVSF